MLIYILPLVYHQQTTKESDTPNTINEKNVHIQSLTSRKITYNNGSRKDILMSILKKNEKKTNIG